VFATFYHKAIVQYRFVVELNSFMCKAPG